MNLDGRRLGAAAGALEPAGKVGGHCAVGAAEPGGLKAVIARHTLSASFEVKQTTPRVARRSSIVHPEMGGIPRAAIDDVPLRQLADLVQPPDVRGRFHQYDLSQFAPEDMDYVESLGYAVR